MLGVQLGSIIYDEMKIENDEIVFNNLMLTLQNSKFKEVRKKIIKLLKVPQLLIKRADKDPNLRRKQLEQKSILRGFIGQRLVDGESDVRYEAYSKLADLKIKIEDFESPKARMLIIKEGATDEDQRVQAALVRLLTPSIIRKVQCTLSESEAKREARDLERISRSRRRSRASLISNNKSHERRSSIHSDDPDNNRESQASSRQDAKEKEVTITKRVFNFSQILKQIDIRHAFVNQYFNEVPLIMMTIVFLVLKQSREDLV